ncbi:myeloid-associated differentiation marker-like protein 2 [Xyrichtys novacula]|uniref:Myeloid-associated differentiation marker-like protein 2 n=1 Tax=Xyrichtys novacula TaxID=13765 RepID=A0AAV1H505_XYRNO|nr:myeloid-associated differentiation marker-like protein 2 [Xyrichtys novacula]
MCGPFKNLQSILRLLEIIFSALALIIAIFRGRMVSPWGIWCDFVWVFCFTVPLVLTVVEAMMWHVLLAAFLPNWEDLTCGLTCLCAVMIISATVIFAAIFVCLSCIASILCVIASLVATIVFLIDALLITL